MRKLLKRSAISIIGLLLVLFLNVTLVHAATSLHTDVTSWQSLVFGSELYTTTADNIFLADEVSSVPGSNERVGPILTFQSANTGLSIGFQIESLQFQGTNDPTAGFIFNDKENGVPVPEYYDALSVGDKNNWDDDDWSLRLLNGSNITAFGVELRDVYFDTGEFISLYSGNTLMDTVDISFLKNGSEFPSFFIGLTTDYSFDRIAFNENPGTDDIAIADFRFANSNTGLVIHPAVAPEPVSTILFVVGGITLGFRRFWGKIHKPSK